MSRIDKTHVWMKRGVAPNFSANCPNGRVGERGHWASAGIRVAISLEWTVLYRGVASSPMHALTKERCPLNISLAARSFWLVALLLTACLVTPASAADSFDAALQMAKRSGRPVLILGDMPGCPHCVALKKLLNEHPKIKPLAARYIPYKANVSDEKTARAMMSRLGLKRISAPTLVIVSPQGKTLDKILGAPQGEPGVRKLVQMLTNGLKNSSAKRN